MTAYELRISDWSSDVCSSDLRRTLRRGRLRRHEDPLPPRRLARRHRGAGDRAPARWHRARADGRLQPGLAYAVGHRGALDPGDRKSGVSGESVSVGVEPGCGGIIKKKQTK